MNIDIIAFLEEKMKCNTKNHYQSDLEFECTKKMFEYAVKSNREEDKTLIWMCRPSGTHCDYESEAFVFDSTAHNVWRFYTEHTNEPIIAYTVEVTGMNKGVITGNVYEMDCHEFCNKIATKSVLPLEIQKTFEDGFVLNLAMGSSFGSYYSDLVEKHGEIVYSRTKPKDPDALSAVLAEQKCIRDKMKASEIGGQKPKLSLSSQIHSAEKKLNHSSLNSKFNTKIFEPEL